MQTSSQRLSEAFDVQVEALTPLHISHSDAKLIPNLDYYEAANEIVVVDPDALVEELGADALPGLSGKFNLATLVRMLFQRGGAEAVARVTRYSLPLLEGVGEIVPELKNGLGQPYLPGSSLKGALRTALAWSLWVDDPKLAQEARRFYRLLTLPQVCADQILELLNKQSFIAKSDWQRLVRMLPNGLTDEVDPCAQLADRMYRRGIEKLARDKPSLLKRDRWNVATVRDRLKTPDRDADDEIIKRFLGINPNFDALRLVQVSDSHGVDVHCLVLGGGAIYKKSGAVEEQSPVFLEYFPSGTRFALRVKLDRFLENVPAGVATDAKDVQIANHLRQRAPAIASIEKIVSACRRMAETVLEVETKFFAGAKGFASVQGVYADLRRQMTQLQPNECILQMAWGAGWTSKTFGSLLKQDAATFRDLWELYLRKGKDATFKGEFPTSCKLLTTDSGQLTPLGWVKVTFTPARGPFVAPPQVEARPTKMPLPAGTARAAEPAEVESTPALDTGATLADFIKPSAKEKPLLPPEPKKKLSASERARREQEEIMRRMRKGE